MKTSLIIEDKVFKEAQKEAIETGKTVSQIITFWATLGKEYLKIKQKDKKKSFKPLQLGEPKLDLSSRKNWMEELEDDRS